MPAAEPFPALPGVDEAVSREIAARRDGQQQIRSLPRPRSLLRRIDPRGILVE
jgi:hypothetical protein